MDENMSADNPDALRRTLNTQETLSDEAAQWLAQLPNNVQPNALLQKFPRIVNRIAALWGKPLQCEKYLNELIFDTREGTRQGFPPEVAFEISCLKALVNDALEKRRAEHNPNYVNVWLDVK